MTTEEVLEEIESYVQYMRENGENDLRSILNKIRCLRETIEKDKPSV